MRPLQLFDLVFCNRRIVWILLSFYLQEVWDWLKWNLILLWCRSLKGLRVFLSLLPFLCRTSCMGSHPWGWHPFRSPYFFLNSAVSAAKHFRYSLSSFISFIGPFTWRRWFSYQWNGYVLDNIFVLGRVLSDCWKLQYIFQHDIRYQVGYFLPFTEKSQGACSTHIVSTSCI